MPLGVGVLLELVDAGKVKFEDECGVARNIDVGFSSVADVVGDNNPPVVAFHHVHQGCGETFDQSVDAEKSGHVGVDVEYFALEGLVKAVTVWIRR